MADCVLHRCWSLRSRWYHLLCPDVRHDPAVGHRQGQDHSRAGSDGWKERLRWSWSYLQTQVTVERWTADWSNVDWESLNPLSSVDLKHCEGPLGFRCLAYFGTLRSKFLLLKVICLFLHATAELKTFFVPNWLAWLEDMSHCECHSFWENSHLELRKYYYF